MTPVQALVVDLLMAVMDSPAAWASAAGDRARGLAWRDAVTARMARSGAYVPYEELVRAEAETARIGDPDAALAALRVAWAAMHPHPDAAALATVSVPLAVLTNCSEGLAHIAVARSGIVPALVLSAQAIGWYKPHPRAYRAAVERLGVAPQACGFIAGAAYDAVGAAAAGLRVVLVRRRPEVPDPPRVAAVADLHAALTTLGLRAGATGSRGGRLPRSRAHHRT